jgi:hypothetical protein
MKAAKIGSNHFLRAPTGEDQTFLRPQDFWGGPARNGAFGRKILGIYWRCS